MRIKTAYIIVVVLVGTATAKILKKEKNKQVANANKTAEQNAVDPTPHAGKNFLKYADFSSLNGPADFSNMNTNWLTQKSDSTNNLAIPSLDGLSTTISPVSTDPTKRNLRLMEDLDDGPTSGKAELTGRNLTSEKSDEPVDLTSGSSEKVDAVKTATPALASTSENAKSDEGAAAIVADEAKSSDSGKADDKTAARKMSYIMSPQYRRSGYTTANNQRPYYTGNAPQLPNLLGGTFGAGLTGSHGNMNQRTGLTFGNIGNSNIPLPESFGNTLTNRSPFGRISGFGANGNIFKSGVNIPLAVETPLGAAIVNKEEEHFRTETVKIGEENQSPPAIGYLSSINFKPGQFGTFGGMGSQFGSFGGLGSQYSGLGAFGSGYGTFGGMSMTNPMMNPMMNSIMNQMVMNQFDESNANEESSVISSSSNNAYPVPLPIPFNIPQPQPYPVPVASPYGVPVPVPQPYPVEKTVEVRVPVNKPYPVPLHQMIPVPFKEIVTVNKPYPVQVPVEVEKPVRVEVPVPFPVPMYQPIKVPEPKPYPVQVRKNVPVPIPFPVPVPQPDNNFHKIMC